MLRADHLILTNGVEDPWKWAGETDSHGDMKAIVIKCKDCAHCVDLSTPTPNDSLNLVFARLRIAQRFSKWFKWFVI